MLIKLKSGTIYDTEKDPRLQRISSQDIKEILKMYDEIRQLPPVKTGDLL